VAPQKKNLKLRPISLGINNLIKKVEERETYISKLKSENSELKYEIELLRGRLFLLIQRLKNIEI
jgi:regulator of replication initiation timing